ncbi:MAG: DivIVA domain-containing protein [Halanaerobiales bacterium]|nr:DivIVA domain-containing protein [Halanaerobiales bacterium]
MKITPLDIYNKEFKKKFSLVAYDGKEVDEFLDHVAAAYERLLKETNQLRDENERINEEIRKYHDMERTLQDTMIVAQETVNNRTEQAEKEARLILESAKIKANEMLQVAKEKVRTRMRQFRQIEEYEQFFRIRLKTLIESHLQLLNENKIECPREIEGLDRELATTYEEPHEDELETWTNQDTERSMLIGDDE